MTLEAPIKIIIDYLDGVTRRSDAVAYARGFIASHFDVPNLSGYYIHKLPGGCAFEIHEGGSQRAFLPKVLKQLDENPTQTILIRSNNRLLQVSRTQKEGFNAILLPEELSQYVGNILDPDENAPRLIPYLQPGSTFVIIGLPVFLLGLILMVSGLTTFALDRALRPRELQIITPYDALPMSQWSNFTEKLDVDHYLRKLQWQNGHWEIQTSDPGNGTAVITAPPKKSEGAETSPLAIPAPVVVSPPAAGHNTDGPHPPAALPTPAPAPVIPPPPANIPGVDKP